MNTLAHHVKTSPRFSRSANVERDRGGSAIEGYLPTGRALDVISRIAGGLLDPASGRTFSITGPHGGGKSSLAVFLDGLLAAAATEEYRRAHEILCAVDAELDDRLKQGVRAVRGQRSGFIRAYATARNEPVTATIARALYAGAVRRFGESQRIIPSQFASAPQTIAATEVKEKVKELVQEAPVLLVVDEFGKNLEYFVSSRSDGDPFLLQELAELTQGDDAAPLVILTLQHLAFDEYVQGASASRRREWSKIQGRFQDIPYVETPAQSRRLIASVIEQDSSFRRAAEKWMTRHRKTMEGIGLRDVAEDAVAAMPLHPLALAVLPELCSRYGQNERTLFSFLAGNEPTALPHFLETTAWDARRSLPLAGLDVLYDYFLESSGSMIGVADGASRWIEIETRIRDTAGLSAAQLKALKTIGILNLVGSGGNIRASRQVLELALAADAAFDADLDELLAGLVSAGLITYRAFSDEYRIWQGSDYNLRHVIESERDAFSDAPLAALLNRAAPLEPLVAGRHSQRTGILRVFAREFCDCGQDEIELATNWDGIVYYVTDPEFDPEAAPEPQDGRPAIYVVPHDVAGVREAAVEAAALAAALQRAVDEGADWVARSELVERAAAAHQRLQVEIGRTWGNQAGWCLSGTGELLNARRGASTLLSEVADRVYRHAPRIANEMIARRELTSQGAKARRFLIDAMLAHPEQEAFGIEGYGPERAIYEAVFRRTGLHQPGEDGRWMLVDPRDKTWKPLWSVVNQKLDDAVDERLNLADLASELQLPPIGLKPGIIPILLIAAIMVRSDEIAVYEHGSLVLQLDDAVAERLTKNLNHFTVKNIDTQRGQRSAVFESLVAELGIKTVGSSRRRLTFLNVAMALFRELRLLPPFAQRTKNLSPEAIAVREAFRQAAEPDVLIFEALPEVFGLEPFRATGSVRRKDAETYARRLADSIRELRNAYPRLLESIQNELGRATATAGDLPELRTALAADAARLSGHVLEPRLRAFVGALTRELDGREWLENVAMVVCDGQAPRVWTDELASLFPLRIAELGGALRRTSALLHERLASDLDQGYDAVRLTLTWPDGRESAELLSLSEAERATLDEHLEPLLDVLTRHRKSRSAACRMLMARLALEHDQVVDRRTDERGSGGRDQRYG